MLEKVAAEVEVVLPPGAASRAVLKKLQDKFAKYMAPVFGWQPSGTALQVRQCTIVEQHLDPIGWQT